MIEDEFEGRGPLSITLAVLAVPLAGEVRVRSAGLAQMRQARGPVRAAGAAVLWALLWLAYVPVILLYEAFAVPLVVGSVVLGAVVIGVTAAIGVPPALVAATLRRRHHSAVAAPPPPEGAAVDSAPRLISG